METVVGWEVVGYAGVAVGDEKLVERTFAIPAMRHVTQDADRSEPEQVQ